MCEMAEYLFKVEVLLTDVNDIYIHRLVRVDKCFEKFKKTLSERYKILKKSKCIMMWIDAEDDLIRIFNESDFMLFVELKGTKIYVIDESIWDEWNDRRIYQNASNIDESCGTITSVSETPSDSEVFWDIVNNEEETAREIEATNVKTTSTATEAVTVPRPAKKPANEIEKINEKAELTEKLIENPKIYTSRKESGSRQTILSRYCIERRQSVPSFPEIGLASSPNQHLNEVSVMISDNDRAARADIGLIQASSTAAGTEEPKEELLHKEATTNMKRRQSVPSNFEIGLTSSPENSYEVTFTDSAWRLIRPKLQEKKKEVSAQIAAIEMKKTIAKTNTKVLDSTSKLKASSTVVGTEEPKENLLHREKANDLRTVFKVPEAISELAVSAENNIDQMKSIYTMLSDALTEASTSSQYKRTVRKRCEECGLFRSFSSSQNSISSLRGPHLKGKTCSACGKYKRKEIKTGAVDRIWVSTSRERPRFGTYSHLREKIKVEPEIPQAMPQRIRGHLGAKIKIEQGIPETMSHALPKTVTQQVRGQKYLDAKIKIEQEIPKTMPQTLPKTMRQANLQARPQLNLTAANQTWKRCASCQLYKSKAGHFHSGLSLVLPHSEGKVCKICGGPEIQRKIFDGAGRTFEEIFSNAFVDIGNNEDVHQKNRAVFPITVTSEMDHLRNSAKPQTESQLQNINFAPAKGSVNNQRKYTGAIPKTTSKLRYKIDEAVNSIMGMGYENVNGRITRLVESVNGDVIEALALLHLLDKM